MNNQKQYPTTEAIAARSKNLARHEELKKIIRETRASGTDYKEALLEISRGNEELKALEQRYDFKSYFNSRGKPLQAVINHLATDDDAK